MPEGRWSFDEDVTDVFEDMLERSIPQYDVMREAVFDISCDFLNVITPRVLDLGCSRGDALAPFVDSWGETGRFYGCDISEPMLKVAQERFADNERVQIARMDLRNAYPPFAAHVTLAVLCVQFTPIEYRQRIIQDVYDHTIERGAFIFVEKILGATARLDDTMVRLYLEGKSRRGYTQEQIDRKRLSLEGVLVPVTAK